MPRNSPESYQIPQTLNITNLPQETLVDYLAHSLGKLEAACTPLPRVERESLMWFHPHEYDLVNSVWQTRGFAGVIEEWGGSRTFASGRDIDIWKRPQSSSEPLPKTPSILLVSHYGLNDSQDTVRSARFRTAIFDTSAEQKHNLIQTLSEVGLLDRAIPVVDDATGAPLRGSPIVNVRCRAEWHASHAGGSGKTDFIISLTIAPPGQEVEVLSLSLSSGGEMFRLILAQRFMETGYEGHGTENIKLSPNELRALLAVVNSVSTERTESPSPFQMGTWLGWTLPEQ
jgi:hypothetical protein